MQVSTVHALKDEDNEVRHRSAKSFSQIAIRELGCKVMIREKTFPVLVGGLSDNVTEIRNACYEALLKAARFQCSSEALVAMGTTLKHVLNLTLEEELQRSIMGLQLLIACAKVVLLS